MLMGIPRDDRGQKETCTAWLSLTAPYSNEEACGVMMNDQPIHRSRISCFIPESQKGLGSSIDIIMRLVWLVHVYLLFIGAFCEGVSKSDVVNIGAIFTFSTINGNVARIAMNAAVKDVNSDPSFLALKYMETDTVAIIGPRASGMDHILSHLANQLHVPLLSFTALDPTLSPLQFSYFIQTEPNDLFQMTALAEMVSYFGYRVVAAVFSDNDRSRNGITALGENLQRGTVSNGSIGLNAYGLYAYDAVWMIANAVKVFLDHGFTISFSNDPNLNSLGGRTLNLGALSSFDGGKQILSNILQTNTTGLTGPIGFVPDRSPIRPSYDIINVVRNWVSTNRGSSQQLSSVVRPGEITIQPRGWVFPNNGRQLRIEVPNRVFDAAVGDIAIVTNHKKIVDFTQPCVELGLVPIRTMKSSPCAFLQPFTPLMWGVTAVFFLIVGAVVWILEHRISDEFRGPPKKQFITILWFSFSTMFFAHRENMVSTLGHFVLIIWLFVILIIKSSYTASLTSILTVQQLSSPIKGTLIALGSSEEYAMALERGTGYVVVDEHPYVELVLSTNCKFSVVGQEFTKSGWGFVRISTMSN
ncbi:glutamate receptor 2 [Actinidia rufa]|uniref:Glutamate receptor 2 n=1 Tax=Actinidia rufa TaxID=165716 RepID=A0A7J0F9B5_9ERIC|nr:glutamate receptor 2 [Actinidia rufa]